MKTTRGHGRAVPNFLFFSTSSDLHDDREGNNKSKGHSMGRPNDSIQYQNRYCGCSLSFVPFPPLPKAVVDTPLQGVDRSIQVLSSLEKKNNLSMV